MGGARFDPKRLSSLSAIQRSFCGYDQVGAVLGAFSLALYASEMIPDAKWLDALRLPLKVTITVALASAALLALTLKGLLDLGPLGPYARPVLTVLLVIFSIQAVVGVIDYLMTPLREKHRQSALKTRRAVRREEREEQREVHRTQVIARLDNLSKEEIRYIADSLRNGSPSFYTYVHSPPVSLLQSKGLVWSPSGPHNEDRYPFSFYDFVWEKLLERKDEFLAIDEEHKRAAVAAKVAQRQRRGI